MDAQSKRFIADMTSLIYVGLVQSEPRWKTMKKLDKELAIYSVKKKLTQTQVKYIRLGYRAAYDKVLKESYFDLKLNKKLLGKNITYSEYLDKVSGQVYDNVRKFIIDEKVMVANVVTVLSSVELSIKKSELFKMILENRASHNYTPFFICSYHTGCAKDHAEYQGRVYYDEAWKNKVTDPTYRAKIEAYINNHSSKSIQWVTGAPVYMCLRPNCTHQFKPVPAYLVLSGSTKRILNNMHMVYEDVPLSQEEIAYKKYSDRLEFKQSLYDVMPNKELAKDIKHDKQLVHKWGQLSYLKRNGRKA